MLTTSLKRIAFLALASGAMILASAQPSLADDKEYSFKVHNGTKQTIKAVLVSEDKKTWGKFNIGDGIEAGATVKLVWDKSTNNTECKQWVKEIFDDGSEAAPAKFDFCEDDLVIELTEK